MKIMHKLRKKFKTIMKSLCISTLEIQRLIMQIITRTPAERKEEREIIYFGYSCVNFLVLNSYLNSLNRHVWATMYKVVIGSNTYVCILKACMNLIMSLLLKRYNKTTKTSYSLKHYKNSSPFSHLHNFLFFLQAK